MAEEGEEPVIATCVERTFFYARTETLNQVTYRFNSWALYLTYAAVLGGVFLYLVSVYLHLLPEPVFYVFMALASAYYVWSFCGNIGWLGEVKKAMRAGSVKVSGSKWSLSNPFVAVIDKQDRPHKDEE